MAKRNKSKGKAGAAIKTLPDLRKLSWQEIYREFHNPASEFGKLALVRQLAENYWRGGYKNYEKNEVERFLLIFIDSNDKYRKAFMNCLYGIGYLTDVVRQKLDREAQLIVFTFLSRSKINGATQGLIDRIRQNPPDAMFLNQADLAARSSRLQTV